MPDDQDEARAIALAAYKRALRLESGPGADGAFWSPPRLDRAAEDQAWLKAIRGVDTIGVEAGDEVLPADPRRPFDAMAHFAPAPPVSAGASRRVTRPYDRD